MAENLRVAITGSTGLIGEELRRSLQAEGHTVHRVVRSRDRAGDGDVYWSVDRGEIDAAGLEGVDVVVNLAGEPIGAKRWTDQQKQEIRSSRVDGTRLMAETLASLDDGPGVLVNGSAVGYYGSRGDEVLPETAAPGDDFLASVTTQWEAAARPAEDAGLRVAHARTGVVIAEGGPLVEKIELPFKLGVGGRIGDGHQWVPWIAIEDEIRALHFLVTEDVSGPVNLVAPEPVTNRQMTEVIGQVMNRPTVLPVPVFGIRLLFGEMGVTLATASQRCRPEVLQEAGFTWEHEWLREPLAKALA